MFSYIILRDIPKDTAQLDVTLFEIQGGFRGFALVPPGAHFLSVKDDGKMVAGTWVFAPPEDTVVRVYDATSHQLVPDTPENDLNYRDLALGGAMNKALIPVMLRDEEFATRWGTIVSHIKAEAFPPALRNESPVNPPEGADGPALEAFFSTTFKSRIEQAFLGTHQGNVQSFLAEFEFAFASWLVEPTNDVAGTRWRHLLQAIYNAGDRFMTAHPDLFIPLVDIIIAQLGYLGEDAFTPESATAHGAKYLAEDLVDTGIVALVEKGHTFEKFLVTNA